MPKLLLNLNNFLNAGAKSQDKSLSKFWRKKIFLLDRLQLWLNKALTGLLK